MRQISVPLPFPGKRLDPDRWLNNLLQNSSIYSTFAKKANTKPPQLLVKKELEGFFFYPDILLPQTDLLQTLASFTCGLNKLCSE